MATIFKPTNLSLVALVLLNTAACSVVVDTDPFKQDPTIDDTQPAHETDTGTNANGTNTVGTDGTDTQTDDVLPSTSQDGLNTDTVTPGTAALPTDTVLQVDTGTVEDNNTDDTLTTVTDTETPATEQQPSNIVQTDTGETGSNDTGSSDPGSDTGEPVDTGSQSVQTDTQDTTPTATNACEPPNFAVKDNENGSRCWQDPVNPERLNAQEMDKHCPEGWRVPTIDELRMLITNCAPTQFYENPISGEHCVVNHYSDTETSPTNCSGCDDSPGQGPSALGCYWPNGLSDDMNCFNFDRAVETRVFWSSSDIYEESMYWVVDFSEARIIDITVVGTARYLTRCVKDI